MNKDGGSCFQSCRDVFRFKAMAEHLARISHLGSRRCRWRCSRQSLLGAEFDIERSLVASSSGEGAANKVLSVSAEGTKEDSSWRRRLAARGSQWKRTAAIDKGGGGEQDSLVFVGQDGGIVERKGFEQGQQLPT
jgi:hypothetical protein